MKAHEIFKQRGYYWLKVKPGQHTIDEANKLLTSKKNMQGKLNEELIRLLEDKILNLSQKNIEATIIAEYDGGLSTQVYIPKITPFDLFNRAFEVLDYKLLSVEYKPFGEEI